MEKGQERSGISRRLWKVAELQKSNFEGPQSQFRNFFSSQLRNRFGCPQYCGVADLNCGSPPLLNSDNWNNTNYGFHEDIYIADL